VLSGDVGTRNSELLAFSTVAGFFFFGVGFVAASPDSPYHKRSYPPERQKPVHGYYQGIHSYSLVAHVIDQHHHHFL
jgi:hypothetical protein